MNITAEMIVIARAAEIAFEKYNSNKRIKDENYYEYRRLSGQLLEMCQGNHDQFQAVMNIVRGN